MKKYKATFSINETWTEEIEAESEEQALDIAHDSEYTIEIYNRNHGKFGIDCDVEEIKST
ncbi:MAG: hypothetical protein RSF40_01235 [Oscillospiraceae bacterium]